MERCIVKLLAACIILTTIPAASASEGSYGNVTASVQDVVTVGDTPATIYFNISIKDTTNATSWFNVSFPACFDLSNVIVNITINGTADPADWSKTIGGSYINASSSTASANANETHWINVTFNLNKFSDVEGILGEHEVTVTTSNGADIDLTARVTCEINTGDVIFENSTTPYVLVKFKNAKQNIALNRIEYYYGDNISFSVDTADEATIKLVDLDTGDVVKAASVSGHEDFEWATADEIMPGRYAIEVYASYSSDKNYMNLTDETTIDSVTGDNLASDERGYVIEISPRDANKPIVRIEMLNPSCKVAKGDLAVFDVYVYGADSGTYSVTGPYDTTKLTEYVNKPLTLSGHKCRVVVDTTKIVNAGGQTGTSKGAYKLVVSSLNTDIEEIFYIVSPDISLECNADRVYLGQKVTFHGTTNVAPSNDMCDGGEENYVKITVYNSTSEEYVVSKKSVKVDADRNFSADVRFNVSWSTGTYKVVAKVYTTSSYSSSDDMTIAVEKPSFDIYLSKYSYQPGKSISVKGTTSLPENTEVIIEVPSELSSTTSYTVKVDANGKFSKSVKVKSDAPYSTYTIKAYVLQNGVVFVEDSVDVEIVPHKLNASIDRTSVAKGGKFTISGTATSSKVYVFADEAGVFEDDEGRSVEELPSETEAFSTAGAYAKVSGGKFTITLKAKLSADPGTYRLYIFAPASSSEIEPVSDAQTTFVVKVTEIGFTEVPSSIEFVKGGTATVEVRVSESVTDDVSVKATLKGYNVRVTETLSKGSEKGLFKLKLYPFYNESSESLVAAGSPNELLPPGTYTLTLKLYCNGEEVKDARTEIPAIIKEPTLDAEVPTEVKQGDRLKITVRTNRDSGYSGIYVVLKTPIEVYAKKVSTDENGTAIAFFETDMLELGEYNVYIRDTMGSIKGNIDDFYSIPLSDAYAKKYYAQDDILVAKTVKIVGEIAPTPTPTATPKPTTSTATPTATPKPTLTLAATPTVTPTATPKKQPGFEAVFAIAGLLAVAYLVRRR